MASKVENDQTGIVWEGEADSFYPMQNIYFPYATDESEADACAFGVDAEGNVTRDTTIISGGRLTYNRSTGYWTCLCPFGGCVKWKLFIWKKNAVLNVRDLSWDGKSAIPVESIIEDINLLKRRVKDMTTHTGRSLKTPEEGDTAATLIPPKAERSGKILGFDANGNPAVGNDVAQVKEFLEQKDLCKDYVEEAKRWSVESSSFASRSEDYANTSKEYCEDALENAEYAKACAVEALGNLEKVQMAGASALSEVQNAKNSCIDKIEGAEQDAKISISEEADKAKVYTKAAQDAAQNAAAYAEESATCADLADADRIRCEELVKSVSGGMRTEVVPALPESGETGVFYFVGSDATGYEEFVWDAQNEIFIRLGSTDFSALRPANEEQYGLIRLGTNEVQTTAGGPVGVTEAGKAFVAKATLTRFGTVCTSAGGAVYPTGYVGSSIYDMGGEVGMFTNGRIYARAASTDRMGTVCLSSDGYVYPTDWAPEGEELNYDRMGGEIGFNVNGRIYARSASLKRFGTVKLGSQFQPTNAQPYVVGIGASSNANMRGQLAFNLAYTQPGTENTTYPDGSVGLRGSLKYARNPNAEGVQYQMYVETASASQLGVVRMLGSMSGYTEDQIEAMRETHAASVGLVLDGIEDFGTNYFTESRIQEFFDAWALGKDLAQQIWDDESKQNALIQNVFSSMLSSASYQSMVQKDVDAKVEEMFADKVTDAYMHELFDVDVKGYAEACAEEYWTGEIDKKISERANEVVPGSVENYFSVYFGKASNIKKISDLVYQSAKSTLEENANSLISAYSADVFNSKKPINVDGSSILFKDFCTSHLSEELAKATSGFDAKIEALRAELYAQLLLVYSGKPPAVPSTIEISLASINGFNAETGLSNA